VVFLGERRVAGRLPVVPHSFLSAYAKICRLEYIKGEAPAVFLPALLTASSLPTLASPAVLEGFAVFALLYVTGFIANALTDRDLDLKYDSFKHEIGEATAFLGPRLMTAILTAHLVAAFALTVHLAVTLQMPVLFALVALGVFLALAYSLPPFHLKVRGLAAHAVALSLSAFAVPFVFLYLVSARTLDVHGASICAAFTLTHYGLTYTNQAYDFDEDLKEGVRTPPVRLGLRRALRASAAMVVLGLAALSFSLVSLAASRDGIASAFGPSGLWAFAVGGTVVLWSGYSVPLRGLARTLSIVRGYAVESEAVPEIRRAVDYARFHASGILGLGAVALVLFATTMQGEVVLENDAAEGMHLTAGAPAVDLSGPAGPNADFALSVVYSGGRAVAAGTAFVRVEARDAGPDPPYYSVTLPVTPRLSPGASAQVEVRDVPLHLSGAGCTVTVTLLFDGDRDGTGLRAGDSEAFRFP
jgi:4-hydroxybenzoate polyprenyltransferase